MSKITKLVIKNLFGISEFEASGKDIELLGANGTGKTSVIDAIRFGLKNSSTRDYIIKEGSEEGEIILETDTGLAINRKVRTDKAPYKSIKEGGKEILRPEEFLRGIFTELQLNPVEFLAMSKNEQNRIVLDLIQFDWDTDWIKEKFGEIPPDVDYNQNILNVLHDIQSEDGYYYKLRQDINRDIRHKREFIKEIFQDLPENYNAVTWENYQLGDIYKKIEHIRNENAKIEKAKAVIENRDNKVRSFKADLEIEKTAIEKEINQTKSNNESEIATLMERVRKLENENEGLEQKKLDKFKLAESEYKTKVSEFEAEVKQYEEYAGKEIEDYSKLAEEAEYAERMKKHINEYRRMEEYHKEVEKLNEMTEDLTAKIEKARTLPGEILETATIPVKNLTVKDGIPLINGLPISNLSEGEKLNLCVEIATQNPNALNILLIDGIEKLSTENRTALYENLKKRGIQFVSTRTDDSSDLTVIEL